MSWQQSAQKTNAKKAAGKVMENLKRKIKCIHMYICVYMCNKKVGTQQPTSEWHNRISPLTVRYNCCSRSRATG